CLLTREEDYAYAQPSLTAKKLRLLEVRAGAPTHKGIHTGVFATARGCAPQSARSRRRRRPPTVERSPTGTPPRRRERAPARHRGAHLVGRQGGQAARQVQAPGPAL